MEKPKEKGRQNDNVYHKPEKELACVVLHAGELSDIRYLKDYLEVYAGGKCRS